MIRKYELAIARFETEAQAVLRQQGLPTSFADLTQEQPKIDSRLALYAVEVVCGIHHLKRKIKKQQMHRALDGLLAVATAYGDMTLYRDSDALGPNEIALDHAFPLWLGPGRRAFEHLNEYNAAESAEIDAEALLVSARYQELLAQRQKKKEAREQVKTDFHINSDETFRRRLRRARELQNPSN